MTPALRAIDLDVGYRTRRCAEPVLRQIQLEVGAGEFVCLLGANGIGKSTLLRTLARMQPPLAGCVEIGGRDIRTLSQAALARTLAVVLTDRPAVDGLTARRVVEIGRYARASWTGGLSVADRAAADWALDAVGAGPLADRDLQRLSDGERQRVMIARALAQEPLVLILDEPTAFLDVSARVELMALLRSLARDQHLSVVISTHDLELALRTADVVWLVEPDGAVSSGAPEDVILAGAVERAFRGRRLTFDAAARVMRWRGAARGSATVRGDGLPAAMARAVLEREGFALCEAPADLQVDVDAAGWRASMPQRRHEGRNFASLAACVRERSVTS